MPSNLEKQLEEERQKREQQSPTQQPPNIEQQIKEFKQLQELESLKLGYENFKQRENSFTSKESELQKQQEQLERERLEFEIEQKKRVDTVNAKLEEYGKQYELLQTKIKEAGKIMEDALKQKAEADRIIKSQTEAEKIAQEKNEAYKAHLSEVLDVFAEIGNYLVKCGTTWADSRVLNIGRTLQLDLSLLKRLQERNSNNAVLAEIIAVDCNRITELAGYLQDTKLKYNPVKVIDYLLKNTDWIEDALLIEWIPSP